MLLLAEWYPECVCKGDLKTSFMPFLLWLQVSDCKKELLLWSRLCQWGRCWTQPSTETTKCVHTWVYILCKCVSASALSVCSTNRTRTAVNVSDRHVYVTFDFSVFHNLPLSPRALLRSLLCVGPQSCLFMCVEAAEERRRLCKCLRVGSFWVRMWSRVINT